MPRALIANAFAIAAVLASTFLMGGASLAQCRTSQVEDVRLSAPYGTRPGVQHRQAYPGPHPQNDALLDD